MGIVSICSLQPGMELATDIVDRNGRKLVAAGVVLDEQHMRILRIWGVSEADVVGVNEEETQERSLAEMDPALVKAVKRHLVARCAYSNLEARSVRELLRFLLLHNAREAERQGLTPEDLLALSPPAPTQDPTPLDAPEVQLTPREIIRDDLKLGSLPVVFHKIVEVVNDPRSCAADVAEIINNDTDLAARVLKLVNSPFYGLGVTIDTVSRAVAILGSNQLVSLAMGISVVTFFRGITSQLVDMHAFWRHSIAVGVGARLLASRHFAANSERFFVAGLLHDVGRLMLFKLLPSIAQKAFERAQETGALMVDAEREILGFTHAALGAALLKEWRLPLSLENNVGRHHTATAAASPQEAAILTTADWLAHGLQIGSSGEGYMPRYDDAVWGLLDAPLSCLPETAAQMRSQTEQIFRFFITDE